MIARSPSAVSKPCRPPPNSTVADKGYDSKALRDWLAERGTTAVIPPRKIGALVRRTAQGPIPL